MSSLKYFSPSIDLLEDDHEYTIVADVAGAHTSSVELYYEHGILVLHGTVRPAGSETRSYLMKEFDSGDYYREIEISAPVDSERINAKLKDGVLVVQLPKRSGSQNQRVSIHVQSV